MRKQRNKSNSSTEAAWWHRRREAIRNSASPAQSATYKLRLSRASLSSASLARPDPEPTTTPRT
jgi:hypothetical protein